MKWISVKDRLPEDDKYYLITDGNVSDIADFNIYSKRFLILIDDREEQSFNGLYSNSVITHWMPLPNPPEIDNV